VNAAKSALKSNQLPRHSAGKGIGGELLNTFLGGRAVRGLGFSGEGDILRGVGPYSHLWECCWKVDDGQFRSNGPSEYEMTKLCVGRTLYVRRHGTRGKERLVVYGDAWRTPREIFDLARGEYRRVGPNFVIGPHSNGGSSELMVQAVSADDPRVDNNPSLRPLDADVEHCWSIAITDDRKYAALGFGNGLVYLHDYENDREVARWNWGNGPVTALGFAPMGTMLAAGGSRDIAVWELPNKRPRHDTENNLLEAIIGGEPNAVAIYSDYLEDAGMPRWDAYDWKSPEPLKMHAQALLGSEDVTEPW
jgi:hypothetical protein